MARNIILTEAQFEAVKRKVRESLILIKKKHLTDTPKEPAQCSCRFLVPNREVVSNMKQFFDDNFAKNYVDDIDTNGYPTKTCTIVMLSQDKTPLKTMSVEDFNSLADDKFHHVLKDDLERKALISQVIKDWIGGNISKDGILSVNTLNVV